MKEVKKEMKIMRLITLGNTQNIALHSRIRPHQKCGWMKLLINNNIIP
jgi:hypothetical protein